MTRNWLGTLCLLWAGAACPAAGNPFPPLSNYAALARPFLLPNLGEPAVTQPSLIAAIDLVNEFENLGFDRNGNCIGAECLRADGQALRLDIGARGALADRWDWRVNVPVLAQSGGFSDTFIERWHGWFNLPNNNRESYPRNEYHYFYRRDGELVFSTDKASTGLGDVTLGLGRHFGAVVLRGEVKLPTGDEQRLAGGNSGGAIWLDRPGGSGAWSNYLSVGASFNARGGPLQNMQNALVPFGGAGLALQLTHRLQLHSQLYFHARLYHDTELRNLYRYGAMLGFGGRWRFNPQLSLDVGMIEDLDVNVSPDLDVQFVFSWSAL